MPVPGSHPELRFEGLIRTVKVMRGTMQFRMECHRAFNYGRDQHATEKMEGGVKFHSPDLHLGLGSEVALRRIKKGVVAEFTLKEG